MRQIFSFTVVIFLHINMILAQTSGANFLQHQDQLLIQDRQDETLVSAQVVDCNAASTGLTSINDLEKKSFTNAWSETWPGGLYPGGSNEMPAAHKLAGMLVSQQIMPMNTSGNPDEINGKVVWLSIGMSNTTAETQRFIPTANNYPNKSKKLIFVDGAQGGMTAGIICTPSQSNYNVFWNTVTSRLTNAGVSSAQVQVIWLKEANPAGTTPIRTYYDSLYIQHKRICHELKSRFPNARLCYLSSRISGRYASSTLNPEPYAYYSGWVVKHLIEDQINGDSTLIFNGTNTRSPFLLWGPYLWSDGSTPQSYNPAIALQCPDDFQSDGTHPSTQGTQKIADWMLDFFTHDDLACSWFFENPPSYCLVSSSSNLHQFTVDIFPNPFKESIQIDADLIRTLELSTISGIIVYRVSNPGYQIEFGNIPDGLYLCRITDNNGNSYLKKLVKTSGH